MTSGKVQALGEHLGADEHIGPVGDEMGQDDLVCALGARDIPIPAQSPRPGEASRPPIAPSGCRCRNAGCGTLWQAGQDSAGVFLQAAMMAVPALIVFVMGQAAVAIAAARNPTTFTAENVTGRSAAVEEQDRLLACVQGLLQGLGQRPAEDRSIPRLEFLAHIDEADFWQLDCFGFALERLIFRDEVVALRLDRQAAAVAHDALRENEPLHAALIRQMTADDIGGRRSQDANGVQHEGILGGNRAGLIARCAGLLFVGIIVGFVKDDQPDLFKRHEQGAARSDHQPGSRRIGSAARCRSVPRARAASDSSPPCPGNEPESGEPSAG